MLTSHMFCLVAAKVQLYQADEVLYYVRLSVPILCPMNATINSKSKCRRIFQFIMPLSLRKHGARKQRTSLQDVAIM